MMHYLKINRNLKLKKRSVALVIAASIAQFTLSCSKSEPDHQTIHFTTKDDIQTTLNIDIEMYVADKDPNLFYINYKYYKKNQSGQWAVSNKPDGPWKVFPDQSVVPKGLLLLK